MGDEQTYLATMSLDQNNSVEESKNVGSPGNVSSHADVLREVGNTWETLTRVELDIACSSEKMLNLNSFMMHVATRESDFEAFASEEVEFPESAQKALEFDFLSGILDLEIRELGNFMDDIHADILNTRKAISSYENLGDAIAEIKVKLQDSEESLKQSLDQVSELRKQSAELESMLLDSHVESNCDSRKDGDVVLQNGRFSSAYSKIKMHSEEQQRRILSMLEKSLARELDLEKKLTELRQTEEEVRIRLHLSEEEALCVEEGAAGILERLLEANNASEILMAICKEKLGELQILKVKLTNALQQENELKSQLQDSIRILKSKDIDFEKLESRSKEHQNLLDEQITKLKSSLKHTEEKLLISNNEASEYKEKAESLKKQLSESELQLQTVVAAAQATEEKENMFVSVFSDMEDEIKDLKLKLSATEDRAETVEAKCIRLSGSNVEMEKHIFSLGSKIKLLEKSLSRAEEVKIETAKSIDIQTEGLKDLGLRLAVERQRLHKQTSTLMEENSFLRKKLKQANKDVKAKTSILDGEVLYSGCRTKWGMIDDEVDGLRNMSGEPARREVHGVRRIDATQMNMKHVLASLVVLLVAIGVCSLEQEKPLLTPF